MIEKKRKKEKKRNIGFQPGEMTTTEYRACKIIKEKNILTNE